MSERDDGGPAYPAFTSGHTATDSVVFHSSAGMSLRDWFAGRAMREILNGLDGWDWERCAKEAYRAADAMLAERAKP